MGGLLDTVAEGVTGYHIGALAPGGLTADDVAAAESVGAVTETPWLLVAGAVGLAASLLAAESVRRRRRT